MKNIFRISGVILVVLSIFLIHSCKKDKPTPPIITTTAASAITQTTAMSGGNITSDGGANVTARGVCWSTTTGPTTAISTKTTDNTGTGIFTSSITALTAGTTYYVKAYATNSAGTGYGNEISFTSTASTIPVLTTTAASAITQTTATSGGNVTSDGGAAVTARGVCWSTTTGPTTALSTKTTDNTGTGIFTSSITALTAGTVYYVRAYATNSVGTAYGNELTLTTSTTLPIINTTVISAITSITASSGGTITSDGGAAVTARGVCWNISSSPTISNNITTNGTGSGSFTSSITGLSAGTTYYVKAYATNNFGTAYGNEVSFTSNPVLVTGITISLTTTNIPKGSAKQLTASILPSNATNKNVIWSSANNSIATVSTSGLVTAVNLGSTTISVTTENGGFSSSCIVNTVPYFSQIGVPYVAVDGLTVTLNSFIVTSTATTYKYTINYTLVNNTPDLAIDEGTFKMYYATKSGGLPQYGSFTKLFPGGTITRSYMFEELQSTPFGTLEYHHDNFFSTTPIIESLKWEVKIPVGQSPTATTSPASNKTSNSATINGTVNPNGYSSVVTFDYGTTTTYGSTITATQNPISGSSLVNVSADLAGLALGTTYHYRVRAENSGGTTNGSDIEFTTLGQVPTSTTLAATNITTVSAQLNGIANPNLLESTVTFEYGTTTSYGSTITAIQSPVTGNTSTNVSTSLSGLTAGTVYHFRIKVVNSLGTTYSNELTFTTLGQVPSATVLSATNTTPIGAQLNGIINANYLSTIVYFEYGASIGYGSTIIATQSPVTGSTNLNVNASITGLIANTAYHYRVKAVNSLGTTYSADRTFTSVYEIGSNANGGVIFYIDGTGQHGLVCTPTDQSSGVPWGCFETTIAGANGTAVGTGYQNTINILSICSTVNIAAKICIDLVLNTYDDWYLPSKDELGLMYTNLKVNGFGAFANDIYWSSTEYFDGYGGIAWAFNFTTGNNTTPYKSYGFYVRAIRAF